MGSLIAMVKKDVADVMQEAIILAYERLHTLKN